MSKKPLDDYDNRKASEKITAEQVRTGDVIAGSSGLNHLFIKPDSFRTVDEVETLPDGNVRIRYTAARGSKHDRTFAPDAIFYRIPAAPELPPLPGELPEPMEERALDRLDKDRDAHAAVCAKYVLENDFESARRHAEKFQELDTQHRAELEQRSLAWVMKEAAEEAAGGMDSDITGRPAYVDK